MPLVLPTLQNAILNAFKQTQSAQNPEQAQQQLAAALAQAIDAYIRSGTVATAGTAAAQTGAIT